MEAQTANILELYRAGTGWARIADTTGAPLETVCAVLREAGFDPFKKHEQKPKPESKPRQARATGKPLKHAPTPQGEQAWFQIPDFPDYAISQFGLVMRLAPGRNTAAGKLLAPSYWKGVQQYRLCRDGKMVKVQAGWLLQHARHPSGVRRPADEPKVPVGHIKSGDTVEAQ